MAWIKVESSVSRNRKFVTAGPAPSWLWLCGLAYCQEGLTDGFIPAEALPYLGVKNARQLATHLVRARLWDVVEGGWRVHDYLKHNKSAVTINTIKETKQAAGKAGGIASGEARREASASSTQKHGASSGGEPPGEPSSVQLSSATATATASAQPLIQRRRGYAAWEGAKGIYVPQRKHTDFIALRNHPNAEAELLAWYSQTVENWPDNQSPGADMLAFWTARFNEKWPAPIQARRDTKRPAWAV